MVPPETTQILFLSWSCCKENKETLLVLFFFPFFFFSRVGASS